MIIHSLSALFSPNTDLTTIIAYTTIYIFVLPLFKVTYLDR